MGIALSNISTAQSSSSRSSTTGLQASTNKTGLSQQTSDNQTKVKISDKARAKLRNEQTEGSVSESSKASSIAEEMLDKAIEFIKEQIKAIQKQLKELAANNDEASKEIRKDLLSQLTQLHGQLLILIQKKQELADNK